MAKERDEEEKKHMKNLDVYACALPREYISLFFLLLAFLSNTINIMMTFVPIITLCTFASNMI